MSDFRWAMVCLTKGTGVRHEGRPGWVIWVSRLLDEHEKAHFEFIADDTGERASWYPTQEDILNTTWQAVGRKSGKPDLHCFIDQLAAA